MADTVVYLNPGSGKSTGVLDLFFSRLIKTLEESKQTKAGPEQWVGTIRSFTQKGVKQAELDDSAVFEILGGFDPKEKITKEALIAAIARRMPRIKRIDLGSAQYSSYKNIEGGKYTERLYVLSSEAMTADDEIENLLYRVEELGFDPSPLMEDPLLVDRLEAELAMLRKIRPDMFDFKSHHYSDKVEKHGKNLMAHARMSKADGLFFVEEIQSDWAQQGRRHDWSSGYPKAPFVTNTEQWAGLVLRDLMQTAAKDPACERFAWLRSNMRNGWQSTTEGDDLQTFYDTIVKKLAQKLIEKAGGRITNMTIETKNGPKDVLGFEMTPKVREALQEAMPLYSRDAVLTRGMDVEDPLRSAERVAVIRECTEMLGSAQSIRFVAKLYDVAQGIEVPGRYLNGGITLSLRARNMDRVARHESWHFAAENFLLPHERREIRLSFAPGAPLNQRTREVLTSMGLGEAASQCDSHEECAAHAFSLWCEGRMEVDQKPKTIFGQVIKTLEQISMWIEKKVFGVEVRTAPELFEAMRSGALQVRAQKQTQGVAEDLDQEAVDIQAPSP